MLNFDSNRPESMAIRNLKDPASHTQRRHSTLSYQTAIKYLDQLTVLDAQRLICQQSFDPVEWSEPFDYINIEVLESQGSDNDRSTDVLCSGTKFSIDYWFDNDTDEHRVQFCWRNRGDVPLEGFDNSILEYVSDRLFNSNDGGRIDDNSVQGFTLLNFADGRSFYAHPLSRNERPKHDWVNIKWNEFEDPVPARVEMFIDLRTSSLKFDNMHIIHPDRLHDGTNDIPILHTNKVLTNSVYAVVRSVESSKCSRNELTKYHLPTSLCYRVKMERFHRLVEVTCFDRKCFAFMNNVGGGESCDGTAIVFHNNNEWGDIFLNGCAAM